MKRNETRDRFAFAAALLVLMAGFHPIPASAGDAIYGKVTAVKSAEVVVLDYGHGQYDVRLAGIVAPKEGQLAEKARELVSKLALGQVGRGRFEYRAKNGEMVSRLFTGDPGVDVGLELVRAGLAQRLQGYDYKYGELSAAEREAREAKRGVWATAQPK